MQGRTGLPPVGWSPARASARMLGDHAAMPGSSAGTATGHDRFGQCNGRLVGGKVCLWMLTSVAPGVKIDDRGEGGRERGRGGGRKK